MRATVKPERKTADRARDRGKPDRAKEEAMTLVEGRQPMTIATGIESVAAHAARAKVNREALRRWAWFALTAGVWASLAWIGALLLQALEAAISR